MLLFVGIYLYPLRQRGFSSIRLSVRRSVTLFKHTMPNFFYYCFWLSTVTILRRREDCGFFLPPFSYPFLIQHEDSQGSSGDRNLSKSDGSGKYTGMGGKAMGMKMIQGVDKNFNTNLKLYVQFPLIIRNNSEATIFCRFA